MTLTVGSLCSGIESTSLGLHLAGLQHRLAYVADNDPAAKVVLAHHHPNVPNLGDLTTVDWATVKRVSLMHMGFPCTDLSCAGVRAGLGDGTRSGVWANCAHAISALHPPLVLIENVPGLLSTPANRSTDAPDSDLERRPAGVGDRPGGPVLRALGAVLGDLADLRYDTVWARVSAADVGAPHLRHRIFILAWDTAAESRVRDILNHLAGPAADPESVGHGNGGSACREGLATTPVGGAVRPDGLNLLPTPNAALGRGSGTPSRDTASRRMNDEGRRFLDDAVALLPTPMARDGDGRGEGSPDYWQRRRDDDSRANGIPLGAAVNLLPTPRATDGTKGGPNQRGSSGDLMLPSAVVQLLPTPRASDVYGVGEHGDGGLDLRTAIARTDRWGEYAPAIARWETVLGRPAPNPTEPGSKGQPRLSARFVEWMQGLPDGCVTSLVARNDALRLLGNTNPPQQYAAAWRHLTAIVRQLLAQEAAA